MRRERKTLRVVWDPVLPHWANLCRAYGAGFGGAKAKAREPAGGLCNSGQAGGMKRTNATGRQALMDCEVRYVGTGRNACATGRRNADEGISNLRISNFK
jgi:hypothetical protein